MEMISFLDGSKTILQSRISKQLTHHSTVNLAELFIKMYNVILTIQILKGSNFSRLGRGGGIPLGNNDLKIKFRDIRLLLTGIGGTWVVLEIERKNREIVLFIQLGVMDMIMKECKTKGILAYLPTKMQDKLYSKWDLSLY